MNAPDLPITIGDRTFNEGGPDADGITWTLGIQAGWWDAPEADSDLLPTIGEGSARGRVMVRHRTIVCKGLVQAPTDALFYQALTEAENLLPVYDEVAFTVHEPGGARYAMVSAAPGWPKFRRHRRAFFIQFAATATDPTKHPVEEP